MLKLSSTWWKYEQTLQRAHTTMLHFRATEPSSSINMPHIHQYIGNECQSILPLVWYHTSFNDLFPETQCLWNLVQEFPPYLRVWVSLFPRGGLLKSGTIYKKVEAICKTTRDYLGLFTKSQEPFAKFGQVLAWFEQMHCIPFKWIGIKSSCFNRFLTSK